MSGIDKTTLWIVILGLGAGSFFLRFVFLGIVGNRALPGWVLRHLRYTSVAILPGLVAPMVVWPAATGGALDAPRLIAGLVTLIVGLWTRQMMIAILCGAATLYLGLALFG